MDERLSHEAVENLVTQFSSALDFFRELVQNSIDAGSSAVDVWLSFVPAQGTEGAIEIHVDDFGEGMNESIIDGQLTKLFSSSKENDLTKIGKFGIGFVSVFALRPQGVLIHTGRDGEFWEVFFHEDRSFTKTKISTPVEGTQITLFLEGDRSRYMELVRGSRETLRRWCSHSDTDITFEDRSPADGVGLGIETINEPFVAAGECIVRVEHPGTELSLAYAEHPSYGFYNRGLALAVTSAGPDVLDGRADRYRHIAMKIKSRYLEHTLSRETVMRDEHYEKAMQFLDQAADGPLRTALVTALGAAVVRQPWDLEAMGTHRRLLRFLSLEPADCLPSLAGAEILRTVDGQPSSLADVEDALDRDGWVYVAAAASSLSARLREQGSPVLLGGPGGGEEDPTVAVITRYLAHKRAASVVGYIRSKLGVDHLSEVTARLTSPEAALVQVDLDPAPTAEVRRLLADTFELLDRVGAGYREIRSGDIEGSDLPRLFVLGRRFGPLMTVPPRGKYERGFREKPRALVNRKHPHFRRLVALHARDPNLATYCLAKALILTEDRALDLDFGLVGEATEPLRGEG